VKADDKSDGFLDWKQRRMRKDLEEAFLATERIWAEKESLSSIRIPRSQQDST
jgi:hypothetical protein